MKILITTDLFRPAINGVVTSVLNLERELEKNGHEVKILAVSDTCSTYQMENVYYIRSVPAKIYPDVRIPVSRGRAYVQEIIEWNPDVIHSQCEFFSFGFAKRIARKTGAVLLHTYHTLYEQYTEYVPFGKNVSREMLGKWMKMRLSCVDAVIAPTKKVERTLREYGLTESEITVIPSGICLDKFQQPCEEEKIKQLRIKYDIPQEARVLLSLGRLGFEKRSMNYLWNVSFGQTWGKCAAADCRGWTSESKSGGTDRETSTWNLCKIYWDGSTGRYSKLLSIRRSFCLCIDK